MILENIDNPQGLTDLAIHEVIHFKISGHGNDFQKEFEKYSGHPMTRYVPTLNRAHQIAPKKRGEGKTLEGKWKVDYLRVERVRCDDNPAHDGFRNVPVKEKAMTKTQAMKIFRMATSKNYPAWLYQYVSTTVAHGWKLVDRHVPKGK